MANGSSPEMLESVLSRGDIDYIALDIKGPLTSYSAITGVSADPAEIQRSIRLVIDSGLPHEMRTTFLSSLLSGVDITEIAGMVKGCRVFFLQAFRATKTLDPGLLSEHSPDKAILEAMLKIFKDNGIPAYLR